MPNWCGNTLTLEHEDPEMIKRAETAFADGKFLKEFVPPPQKDWDYNWCVENWGTKWDVGSSDGINVVEENSIVFYFDSAWAPPIAAYKAMEELGFTVSAMYYEPGLCFAGIYEDGHDDYYEYSGMTSEEVADLLPAELDETFNISEQMADWEEENEDE